MLKDERGNRIGLCVGGEYDGDHFFVANDAKTGDTLVPTKTQVNRPRYRLDLENDRWIFDGIDADDASEVKQTAPMLCPICGQRMTLVTKPAREWKCLFCAPGPPAVPGRDRPMMG